MTKCEAIEILEEVKTLDDSMFTYSQAYNDALDMAIKALKAQAPVVHGRWIAEPDRINHWHCSICGLPVGMLSLAYRYCYCCGARMDGERRDGE